MGTPAAVGNHSEIQHANFIDIPNSIKFVN